ncbi:MAG: hypothetical protein GF418_01430 [Chitinivibrionales bacterium]|nr:hypothetical protein [Chitinivibrionales bacterium]MBD3394264.1 hypothetical protein [Chitinivibrionales bacterium]
MARRPRFECPGVMTHVMARGIDGKDIYNDNEDRYQFCSRLERLLARTGFRCLAWALQDNHFHLVVRPTERPLHVLMQPLNSGYARWFNKKYDRRGYLFQDRFKSIASQDQEYSRELIRYVHLNPLRAGVVASLKQLRRYRWCGHGTVMGESKGLISLDSSGILRRFGKNARAARRAYEAFLEKGLGSIDTDEITPSTSDHTGADLWGIVGDAEFIRSVLRRRTEREAVFKRRQAEGWTIERVVEFAGTSLRIPSKEVFARGHSNKRSDFRVLTAYLAVRQVGLSCAAVARFLGTTAPAVSQMVARGEGLCQQTGISIA